MLRCSPKKVHFIYLSIDKYGVQFYFSNVWVVPNYVWHSVLLQCFWLTRLLLVYSRPNDTYRHKFNTLDFKLLFRYKLESRGRSFQRNLTFKVVSTAFNSLATICGITSGWRDSKVAGKGRGATKIPVLYALRSGRMGKPVCSDFLGTSLKHQSNLTMLISCEANIGGIRCSRGWRYQTYDGVRR